MSAVPYTAERAYRVSVRPLAALMIIGGLVFPAVAMLSPYVPRMPFAESAAAKRILMAVFGFFLLPIGIGLWLKLKVAWYAMFVYIVGGTIFNVIGFWLCTPADNGGGVLLGLVGILLNGVLTVGLYFVTRPVFARPHQAQDSP